jgi:hypothetical protein
MQVFEFDLGYLQAPVMDFLVQGFLQSPAGCLRISQIATLGLLQQSMQRGRRFWTEIRRP